MLAEFWIFEAELTAKHLLEIAEEPIIWKQSIQRDKTTMKMYPMLMTLPDVILYKVKRIGLCTGPWGTPITNSCVIIWFIINIYKLEWNNYDLNHFKSLVK